MTETKHKPNRGKLREGGKFFQFFCSDFHVLAGSLSVALVSDLGTVTQSGGEVQVSARLACMCGVLALQCKS